MAAEPPGGGRVTAPVSADGLTWNERLTRAAVAGRSNGYCEWCARQQATDKHHRRNASQGGGWHPSNIVNLCRECHQWVTVNPEEAHAVGLTLWTDEDPADTPIRYGTLAMFLSDELIAKAGVNAHERRH